MTVTSEDRAEQRRGAAEMWFEGETITSIAERYDVSRITVYRWLHRPDVAGHLRYLTNCRTVRLLTKYDQWAEKAVDDPECPHAVKATIWRVLKEDFRRVGDVPGAKMAEDKEAAEEAAAWQTNPFGFLKEVQ